jgi:hypothetical protein
MERERIEQIVQQNPGMEMPTHCIHIYKNRRGEHNFVKVWCSGFLGTCRIKPLFATDNNFNIVNIPGSKITVKEMLKF